jgi:protein TonB
MEDRVGDVLARRAALENSVAPAILFSIVLHAGITGFALWRAWQHPASVASSVIQIQFKSMTPMAPIAAPKHAVTAPLPKSVEPPKPQPVPKMEVPDVPRPATPPIAKPNDKAVPFGTFGKSTKKGSDAVVPPPPAATTTAGTAKPGTAPAIDVPVGGSGVTGLEGDFRDAAYVERMRMLIGTHWLRPAVTGAATTVHFVIDRDGRIRDAAVETASGNSTFDRAALRAILETSPLPPLPFTYNGAYVGVHLTFK